MPQGIGTLAVVIKVNLKKSMLMLSLTLSTFQIFKGHNGAVTCMATDTEGKTLYTGSADATIKSWNIATGQILRVSQGFSLKFLSLEKLGVAF